MLLDSTTGACACVYVCVCVCAACCGCWFEFYCLFCGEGSAYFFI